MTMKFWIKRFLTVLVGAFVVISTAQWLKGHDLAYAVGQGGLWGSISALVFVVAAVLRPRSCRFCSVSNDTPDGAQTNRESHDV